MCSVLVPHHENSGGKSKDARASEDELQTVRGQCHFPGQRRYIGISEEEMTMQMAIWAHTVRDRWDKNPDTSTSHCPFHPGKAGSIHHCHSHSRPHLQS